MTFLDFLIDAEYFAQLNEIKDDLKISSPNPIYLQKALDIVNNWSNSWQLRIHPTKSEHISFSRPSTNTSITNTFSIQNCLIQETQTVRDLGIYLANDLNWSVQTANVYTKSITKMYSILRSFKTTNLKPYITIYKTYIRSIIEYNSTIWNPDLKSDIRKIESILYFVLLIISIAIYTD